MNTFESIKIGDTAELSHLMTEADIEKFVELTGDDNKLHIDAGFASKTVFKKPVVHGMLGASFISTIIGTKLPGDGALWYSQSFEFLRPVRVGDTIRVTAAVIEKNARTKSISLKTDIFNGSKQLVTTGIAKVKIIEIPEEKPEDNSPELLPHVAFVAGAVGGIGRETALRLAKDGFDLVITYNRKKAPALLLQKEITALGRKCLVVQCDVSSKQSVEEAVATA
ncbi:MAG: SDR family NAD(P)-dependent oxidoreductase, partial [Ignavibacteriales bacterium]|nr:SDR family NAD(P)-dependent oxidoreductase [Ignavibacteriales bacterium]